MSEQTYLLPAEKVRAMAEAIVRAMGAGAGRAGIVADHLVTANLYGHDSHGVGMLPKYVAGYRAGLLRPAQELRIVSDLGAALVCDGGMGLGQVMGREAMRRGIEAARRHGVAVISLRNAFHLGRIGTYAEQCAEAGLASMHYVNVNYIAPLVAPWGGRDARFGTNPFAAALPMPGEDPIVLDMATSRTALGKVRVARNRGERFMAGALIDARGEPSDDPEVMFSEPMGAILPFGEHKGHALAMICELFAGALTGGETYRPERRHPAAIQNNMLSVLLTPEAVGGEAYAEEARRFRAWVKASPPAAGADRVMMPGEPERRSAEARRREGLPIDARTLAELAGAAAEIGAEWPEGLPRG
ncbi:MAG: malate/lactate/ureidoglycolate dehydrogenase [Alphaproteobacteria bacterium]|nr:malate/lactate/ureidoglycolate dehydrogenase [Alphaproteobacteria bacterium]